MAIFKKDQQQQIRNVLLRVSIPAPLMAEIKKTKKSCIDNGFYFDIRPDVISAVEIALEAAKNLVNNDNEHKDHKADHGVRGRRRSQGTVSSPPQA